MYETVFKPQMIKSFLMVIGQDSLYAMYMYLSNQRLTSISA